MLGFVAGERWTAPGRMERWRCAWQRGYGTEAIKRRFFGRPALFVRYRALEGLKTRQEAARKRTLMHTLNRNGVDKLAFSTFGDMLEGQGPRRVDSGYLHLYFAGDVGAHVADGDGKTAACFFHLVGHLEERAILKLAEHFRYLMIASPRDGEAVCRALRRRYGLPVVESPTASQMRQADFALLSGPVPKGLTLGENCLSFAPDKRFAGEMPGGRAITELFFQLPEEVAEEIPEGFMPDPLLSEALFCGSLNPEKIKIHGVSIDKSV